MKLQIKPTIGIYKITNPEGEVYIGQSKCIERRYWSYYYNRVKGQIYIEESLNKFGFSNHTFEIIEECEIKDLHKRENYWQMFYKAKLNKPTTVIKNNLWKLGTQSDLGKLFRFDKDFNLLETYDSLDSFISRKKNKNLWWNIKRAAATGGYNRETKSRWRFEQQGAFPS